MQSKHLEKWAKLNGKLSFLRGNRLLVEIMPKEELVTKGGLIVATSLSDHRTPTQENRPTLAVVLAAGPGYYDAESGKDVPLDVSVGSLILVSAMSLKHLTEIPGYVGYVRSETDQIALSRDTEIHMSWPSLAAFEEYKALLNS